MVIGLGVLAAAVKQPTTGQFTIPGTQAQRALDLLNQHFPGTGGAQAQVVFSAPDTETLTGARQQAAVKATLSGLRKAPQVVSVSDPYTTGTISASKRIAYATVAYRKSFGLSLSLGVLIDAFTVRMTLVPAAMALSGESAWWLPRRLARVLPHLDVEGSQLGTQPASTQRRKPRIEVTSP